MHKMNLLAHRQRLGFQSRSGDSPWSSIRFQSANAERPVLGDKEGRQEKAADNSNHGQFIGFCTTNPHPLLADRLLAPTCINTHVG